MKVKIKDKDKFDPVKGFSYRKRGYYFHADEDFREDWDWGKTKTEGLAKDHLVEKKTTDSLIS
ncbi:hypothetical protein HDE68_003680 [Pedobacter cryoconitis]|uniref:Uncharacterized protein n=1 Tax=Pedobacter cryoconitis TaxID=188932 RepID=A0A7W8ZPQ9_9SPHI|nr:hypothetical protein [Pedobacter cryoconitis]MBB5637755.1 hypothetical protein [Pedobacter cryoconitis]